MGQAWIGIGLMLGTAANWIFVAARLRRFSKVSNDAITVPQYLRNRFKTKNPALQIICAIIFLVCFTLYVASGFVAGAKVLISVIPGLTSDNAQLAVLIFALIIIVYTFTGGFKAVCWTDFIQAIMMIIAIVALPIVMLIAKDLDTSALTSTISTSTGNYTFVTNPFKADFKTIINGLAWGLGYFGMPHILVRFMSIKNAKLIKKSATVAIIWVVISLAAAIAIAFIGRMIYGAELLENGAQETIFITAVTDLFPAFIAGLLLSAIIAAAMSTADSQLLVASSSFTSDIYKPVFRKQASDKEVLWVGRAVVIVVSVIAFFIASAGISNANSGANAIMNMVENAWAGFGSAFGPVIILSLFWRRVTYKGAVAGVSVGALVDVIWLFTLGKVTGIYEIIPGFILGLIACIIVSLIDKEPSQEIKDLFDKATSPNYDEEEALAANN
jgi:sodium/proline symporter